MAQVLACIYFLILFPFVLSTVHVSIQGQAQAQATATAGWQRSSQDPPIYGIAKVKLDENPALTSTPFAIPNPAETSGSLPLPFDRAGIFHLLAFDQSGNVLETGTEFGVQPPSGLSSGVTSQPTSAVTSEPTQATSSSTSSSITPPVIPNTPPPPDPPSPPKPSPPPKPSGATSSSNLPLIISSVVGSVFLVFFVGILLYLVRSRRILRRKAPSSAYSSFSGLARPSAFDSTPSTFPPDLEKRIHPTDASLSVSAKTETRPASYGYPFKNRRITATTFASLGTEISSIRFNPLTGRQIELETRITKLNATWQSLKGVDNYKASKVKAVIDQLTKLKDSPYAMGLTDEVPPGWR